MWGVRFPADQREVIDAWAKENSITRAEAIRRLVHAGVENLKGHKTK